MRGLDESYRRLDVLDYVPILGLRISKSLSDVRFLFRELGIFPIIYFFRKRVINKLFHQRILPALIFFESGKERLFLFGGFRSHRGVLFFGRVYYKIEHFVVKLNSFQFFPDKLDKFFFAQVRLRTPMRPEGFGASVVNMTFLLLRRDLESALTAHHESAVGVFPRFCSSDKLRRGEYALHLVEKLLRNNRLMRSDMGLSVPLEHPAVDRIFEDSVESGFVDDLSSTSSKPLSLQFLGDGNDRMGFCRIERECFSDASRFFLDDNQSLCFGIAGVPEGRGAGILSSTHFLRLSSFHISTQVSDVLIRHGKLDARNDDIIFRIVITLECFDLLDYFFLEKPLYQPLIHGIARQPINLPAEYSFRFAFLDEINHLCKYRATRFFR